jgi:hypothetical protein
MHPAIELLIARMQSNPEEFIRGEWEMEEDNCMAHANEEELAALKATRRTITLDGIHKQIMNHLLNPVQLDLFSPNDYAQNTQQLNTQSYQNSLQNVLGKLK